MATISTKRAVTTAKPIVLSHEDQDIKDLPKPPTTVPTVEEIRASVTRTEATPYPAATHILTDATGHKGDIALPPKDTPEVFSDESLSDGSITISPTPSAPPCTELIEEGPIVVAPPHIRSPMEQMELARRLTASLVKSRMSTPDMPTEFEVYSAVLCIISEKPHLHETEYEKEIGETTQRILGGNIDLPVQGLMRLLSDRSVALSVASGESTTELGVVDVLFKSISKDIKANDDCILRHVRDSLDLDRDNFKERILTTINAHKDLKEAMDSRNIEQLKRGLEELYVQTVDDIVNRFNEKKVYSDAKTGKHYKATILDKASEFDSFTKEEKVAYFHNNLRNAWLVQRVIIPCKHSIVPAVFDAYISHGGDSTKVVIEANNKLTYISEKTFARGLRRDAKFFIDYTKCKPEEKAICSLQFPKTISPILVLPQRDYGTSEDEQFNLDTIAKAYGDSVELLFPAALLEEDPSQLAGLAKHSLKVEGPHAKAFIKQGRLLFGSTHFPAVVSAEAVYSPEKEETAASTSESDTPKEKAGGCIIA